VSTNKLYTMTSAEMEILRLGAEDPTVILDYFSRKPGAEHGFQFDYNFTEEGKWQKEMCQASQTFIVCVAGISTGKTLGVGMAAVTHAILTSDFKFLNVAREAWQSQLMYNEILAWSQGTLLEKLITASPKRPYPMIVIEYILNGIHVRSTLEFMSIGEKEDAANIFSWRGDWINIDEAGRLDDLGTIVANLSTRGTGATPGGRSYLGRISLITNPWDNPDLWILFDMAAGDPENSLALNIDTSSNKNTTKKQIEQIIKINRMVIGSGDIDRFLTGKRPEGRGTYFPIPVVEACSSKSLSASLADAMNAFPEQCEMQTIAQLGTYYYKMPKRDGRIYFLVGDPGTGAPPARNAYVVMVLDVTEAGEGKPATLVALSWGNGGGRIEPFTEQVIDWIKYYRPIFAGVDSTGPQKNTAEIVSLDRIYGKGLSVNELSPMDFSGSKRYTYLGSLRIILEAGLILWPHVCKGIGSQLKNYDPIVDRNPNAKLAQDLVATLAMAAFAIHAHYGIIEEESSDVGGKGTEIVHPRRFDRSEGATWSNRAQRDSAGRSQSDPGKTFVPMR
jgi:hypothetical protein